MAAFAEKFARKRREVEQEIENHGKTWCHPNCTLFIERAYRQHRLMSDMSADEVQNDYYSCHTSQTKPP